MSKSVNKCSIHVNFCHFLQTIKFALTPLLTRTNPNLTPKSYLPCQMQFLQNSSAEGCPQF